MRSVLSGLFICMCFMLRAQENPIPVPISFFDGKAVIPYQNSEALQKTAAGLHIRSYTIAGISSNDLGIRDTYNYLTEQFSLKGIRLTYDPWLGGRFEGFTQIGYNKDQSISSLQYRMVTTLGCGNGGVKILDQLFRTEYTYSKAGELTMERYGLDADSNGKRFRTIMYSYDKKGLLSGIRDFYPPADTGDTMHMDSYRYRYDAHNKLVQAYQINKNYNRLSEDSLAYLPDDFGQRLLRQSYSWKDSALLLEYGGTYMDLINGDEDTSEALKQALDKRDDTDLTFIDIYTPRARGFTGYQYNDKGLLVRRLSFVNDDLGSKDDFGYDGNGRLVYWQNLQIEETPKDLNGTAAHDPVKLISNFEYNAAGRVARLVQLRYECEYHSATNTDYRVFLASTDIYIPSYNTDGTIKLMQVITEKKGAAQQESNYLIRYGYY